MMTSLRISIQDKKKKFFFLYRHKNTKKKRWDYMHQNAKALRRCCEKDQTYHALAALLTHCHSQYIYLPISIDGTNSNRKTRKPTPLLSMFPEAPARRSAFFSIHMFAPNQNKGRLGLLVIETFRGFILSSFSSIHG